MVTGRTPRRSGRFWLKPSGLFVIRVRNSRRVRATLPMRLTGKASPPMNHYLFLGLSNVWLGRVRARVAQARMEVEATFARLKTWA